MSVSRSAYYAWREGGPSQRAQQEATLTPWVRAVFWKHRRRYGARRLAEELADLGEVCRNTFGGSRPSPPVAAQQKRRPVVRGSGPGGRRGFGPFVKIEAAPRPLAQHPELGLAERVERVIFFCQRFS